MAGDIVFTDSGLFPVEQYNMSRPLYTIDRGAGMTDFDFENSTTAAGDVADMTSSSSFLTQIGDKSLAEILWIFVGPVIFTVGMIGNTLILLIMSRRCMKGTTTSIYLRLMAAADLVALISGMIPEWLEAAGIVIFKRIHPATCKMEKFTFYTSSDTSIWVLVIFTVDRFIAVCFPLKKKDFCIPSRARIYCLCAFLLAVSKNFHVFWTRGAQYFPIKGSNETEVYNCGRPTPAYEYFEKFVRPWIVFSFVNILPFCVVLVANVFIIRALIHVKKMRVEQSIISNRDKSFYQMASMCLSASFSFLICVTPSIVLLIGRPWWSSDDNNAYIIAKAINNQLTYVNHSINFFLYCVTGKRFRYELVNFCRRRESRRGYESQFNDTRTATVYRFTNSANSKTPNLVRSANAKNSNGNSSPSPTTYQKMSASSQNLVKNVINGSGSANDSPWVMRTSKSLNLPSPERESSM